MIYLLLFLLEAFFLYRLECTLWKTMFTPLNCLMLPYVAATIVAIVYSYLDPYTPNFYFPSLIIWMVGLLIFVLPSMTIGGIIKKKWKKMSFTINVGRHDDNYPVLKYVAYGCILLSLLKIRSLSNNINEFGTGDFSTQYQASSVLAHLSVLLGAIFSLAIYKADERHKSAFVIIAGALIGMYAVGTKSWIIAPFLMGYIARVMAGRTSLSFKTTFLPLIIIFIIFLVSYFISIVLVFGNEASSDFWGFIVNHFTNYVSGSSLSLSIDYKKGFLEPNMTEALFGPPINLIHAITGEPYVNPINYVFIDIGTLGESNVRTFFGTIYAYSKSPVLFVLMPFAWSLVIYWIYFLSRRSHSIFLMLATCSNMTFLIFGFFDFYWLTLSCYEIFVIFLLLHMLCYKQPQKKHLQLDNKIYGK